MAQAMSMTSATAPMNTSSAGRLSPTSCSCSPTSSTPHPVLLSGYSASSRRAIVLSSPCASEIGDTRAEAAHHRQEIRAPRARRVGDERCPDIHVLLQTEGSWRYPDDGMRHPAEQDRASHDAAITPELPLPEAVAQYRDPGRSGALVIGREHTSHGRRHSEHREETRRGPGAAHDGRLALGREVVAGVRQGGHVREGLGLALPVEDSRGERRSPGRWSCGDPRP